MFENCEQAAIELKNENLEGYAIGNMGMAYRFLKMPDDSIKYHKRGFDLCKKSNYLKGKAADLIEIGLAHLYLNHYDQASNLLSRQKKHIHRTSFK